MRPNPLEAASHSTSRRICRLSKRCVELDLDVVTREIDHVDNGFPLNTNAVIVPQGLLERPAVQPPVSAEILATFPQCPPPAPATSPPPGSRRAPGPASRSAPAAGLRREGGATRTPAAAKSGRYSTSFQEKSNLLVLAVMIFPRWNVPNRMTGFVFDDDILPHDGQLPCPFFALVSVPFGLG